MGFNILIKYFIFIYLLAISSFEFFFRVSQPALYVLLPLVSVLFFYYGHKIRISALKIIVPFIFAVILQGLLYGASLSFSISLLLRLISIYFSVVIIGVDFIRVFIKSMKFIAIYSLLFYVIQFDPTIHNLLLNVCGFFTNLGSDPSFVIDRPNFILYTIPNIEPDQIFYRNFGPFWEPGLFVMFLNIALYFNLFCSKKILTRLNLLFIICIITTFSTTGTIVLFLIISAHLLTNVPISNSRRIFIFLSLVLVFSIVWTLPFMNEKIVSQFEQSDVSFSRFGAVVVHWRIIQDYPWVGMPIDSGATFSKYTDRFTPNGLTEIFTIWGVFIGLLYYVYLYKSSQRIMSYIGRKKHGLVLFLVLTISLFSENMGNRPIYLMFLFMPIVYDNIKNYEDCNDGSL